MQKSLKKVKSCASKSVLFVHRTFQPWNSNKVKIFHVLKFQNFSNFKLLARTISHNRTFVRRKNEFAGVTQNTNLTKLRKYEPRKSLSRDQKHSGTLLRTSTICTRKFVGKGQETCDNLTKYETDHVTLWHQMSHGNSSCNIILIRIWNMQDLEQEN